MLTDQVNSRKESGKPKEFSMVHIPVARKKSFRRFRNFQNNFAASVPGRSLFLRFGGLGQRRRVRYNHFDLLLLN